MDDAAPGSASASDNAVTKVALAVIRLVAFGLIVISLLLCSGEAYYYYSQVASGLGDVPRVPPPPPHWGWVAVKLIPILIAIILLLKSRALAGHFTKDYD